MNLCMDIEFINLMALARELRWEAVVDRSKPFLSRGIGSAGKASKV